MAARDRGMWPAPCFCFRHGVDGRDDPVDLLDIVPEPLHLAVEPYFCESSDGESLQFRQLDLGSVLDCRRESSVVLKMIYHVPV